MTQSWATSAGWLVNWHCSTNQNPHCLSANVAQPIRRYWPSKLAIGVSQKKTPVKEKLINSLTANKEGNSLDFQSLYPCSLGATLEELYKGKLLIHNNVVLYWRRWQYPLILLKHSFMQTDTDEINCRSHSNQTLLILKYCIFISTPTPIVECFFRSLHTYFTDLR